MAGVAGLDDHAARLFAPPGPAGRLQQQLEGALGRPVIRQVQAEIRVGHDGQGHVRKMMALGEHLRAHQHGGLLARERAQDFLHAAGPAGAVAVQAQNARARRQERAENFLQLFRALAHGQKIQAAATRARRRVRRGPAAVMAEQALAALVVGQPDVAVRALGHRGALQAVHQRRVAPAVEHDYRLLAPLHHGLQGLQALGRQRGTFRALFGQGHHAHLRQFAAAHALVQQMQRNPPFPGRVIALHVRRGRTHEQQRPLALGPVPGNLLGLVHKALVLLERGIVLLVQNDQAHVVQRQQKRGSRPHHQTRHIARSCPASRRGFRPGPRCGSRSCPGPCSAPCPGPRPGQFAEHRLPGRGRQVAVEQMQPRPRQSRFGVAPQLERQRHLGRQQQHGSPARQHLARQFQVHGRLAAAGYAEQQPSLGPAGPHRLKQRLEHFPLLRRQTKAAGIRRGDCRQHIIRRRAVARTNAHDAPAGQQGQRGRSPLAQIVPQFSARHFPALVQILQHGNLRPGRRTHRPGRIKRQAAQFRIQRVPPAAPHLGPAGSPQFAQPPQFLRPQARQFPQPHVPRFPLPEKPHAHLRHPQARRQQPAQNPPQTLGLPQSQLPRQIQVKPRQQRLALERPQDGFENKVERL